MTEQLRQQRFQGVNGPIAYTEVGDRKDARYLLHNLQSLDTNGEYAWVKVAEIGQTVRSTTLAVNAMCFAGFGCFCGFLFWGEA